MFLAIILAGSALMMFAVAFNRVAKGHIMVGMVAAFIAIVIAGIAGALAGAA